MQTRHRFGELRHGAGVVGIVSGLLLVFATVFSVLTTAFGSTNDFRVGLEEKSVFSRHRQTQVYLDQAQETHKRIEVRGHCLSCDAPWDAEFFFSSFGSILPRAYID